MLRWRSSTSRLSLKMRWLGSTPRGRFGVEHGVLDLGHVVVEALDHRARSRRPRGRSRRAAPPSGRSGSGPRSRSIVRAHLGQGAGLAVAHRHHVAARRRRAGSRRTPRSRRRRRSAPSSARRTGRRRRPRAWAAGGRRRRPRPPARAGPSSSRTASNSSWSARRARSTRRVGLGRRLEGVARRPARPGGGLPFVYTAQSTITAPSSPTRGRLGAHGPAAHLAHLRADAAALLAADRADPDAPAWAGPGWDRTDAPAPRGLRPRLGRGRSSTPARPSGSRLPRRRARARRATTLSDVLRGAARASCVDAAGRAWTSPRPGRRGPARARARSSRAAWRRRPPSTGGTAPAAPIDADLAVDGVDELLELFAPAARPERVRRRGGTSTSTPPTSTGRVARHARARRASPSSTATPRATSPSAARASDLLLWTWNRVPVDDRFEVIGDRAAAERWRDRRSCF